MVCFHLFYHPPGKNKKCALITMHKQCGIPNILSMSNSNCDGKNACWWLINKVMFYQKKSIHITHKETHLHTIKHIPPVCPPLTSPVWLIQSFIMMKVKVQLADFSENSDVCPMGRKCQWDHFTVLCAKSNVIKWGLVRLHTWTAPAQTLTHQTTETEHWLGEYDCIFVCFTLCKRMKLFG